MVTDVFGRELRVGAQVIYNQSGRLAKGEVVKITENRSPLSKRYPHLRHTIHVKPLVDSTKISKVKNTEGIARV